MLPTNRGFWLTIILSIVTLGIYQWYLVYAFARETNIACRRDGQNTQGWRMRFNSNSVKNSPDY
uniref:DUF4234 domain-containing protein n=2 Tax=Muribaculum intestinale TaxID=1796646 RepID=UPI0025B63291